MRDSEEVLETQRETKVITYPVVCVCSVSSACLKTWVSSTHTRLTCTLSPGLTTINPCAEYKSFCVCVLQVPYIVCIDKLIYSF